MTTIRVRMESVISRHSRNPSPMVQRILAEFAQALPTPSVEAKKRRGDALRAKTASTDAAIVEWVRAYVDECGESPTFYQISVAVGVSDATVANRISILRERGVLEMADGAHRAIRVVGQQPRRTGT